MAWKGSVFALLSALEPPCLGEGRLSLNVRLFADERDRRVVTGLTHQFLLTLLGAASGIVAALLLSTPGGPKITPTVSLYQVIGYNLLIVASILALRVLFTIFRIRQSARRGSPWLAYGHTKRRWSPGPRCLAPRADAAVPAAQDVRGGARGAGYTHRLPGLLQVRGKIRGARRQRSCRPLFGWTQPHRLPADLVAPGLRDQPSYSAFPWRGPAR